MIAPTRARTRWPVDSSSCGLLAHDTARVLSASNGLGLGSEEEGEIEMQKNINERVEREEM